MPKPLVHDIIAQIQPLLPEVWSFIWGAVLYPVFKVLPAIVIVGAWRLRCNRRR